MENQKNSSMVKILAWIGLIVIATFILMIAYALYTRNGQLALAMTVALIFVSIIFWIGIKVYKAIDNHMNLINREKEREDFINNPNINAKNK